ncbi:hypothetical protein EVAR_40116_1 [Eumeta japonica]|uniref:Uncharacterized protein n=1 Tax=Eumeta variegata TaxID=151549 RepID=A0A4C1W9K0_EUMVA|nr:hypothetical protein EVAR_40116_1 [Eumeta japonica]
MFNVVIKVSSIPPTMFSLYLSVLRIALVPGRAPYRRDLDENGRVIQCQPQTPCGWVIYIPSPVHRSPMKGYRESHLMLALGKPTFPPSLLLTSAQSLRVVLNMVQ